MCRLLALQIFEQNLDAKMKNTGSDTSCFMGRADSEARLREASSSLKAPKDLEQLVIEALKQNTYPRWKRDTQRRLHVGDAIPNGVST
ncbi:hypothetical protein PIB30_088804 [Stylosanthes scabra]|uniref:Uncharacterized protein n=1 Tax=Stylosanthes scabra TaxID=79078 RepID=A0ABU6WX78_9FABA|nr:hypothetical protein [Stylosanthes scabra]